jgi:hypothetical protein
MESFVFYGTISIILRPCLPPLSYFVANSSLDHQAAKEWLSTLFSYSR